MFYDKPNRLRDILVRRFVGHGRGHGLLYLNLNLNCKKVLILKIEHQ